MSILRVLKILFFSLFFKISSAAAKPETAVLNIWHEQNNDVSTWIKKVWAGTNSKLELNIQSGIDMEVALFRTKTESDLTPDAVIVVSHLVGLHSGFGFSEIPRKLIDPIENQFKESVKIGPKYYGLPLFTSEPLVLFYNKALVSKPIDDIAEIISGKKTLEWPLDSPFYFCPFIGAFGDWTHQMEDLNLSSNSFQLAFENYFSVSHKLQLKEKCEPDCEWQKFISGQIQSIIAPLLNFKSAEDALKKNLGYTNLPKINGHYLQPVAGSYALAFPSRSLNGPKGKELLTLSRELLSPKNQTLILALTNHLPVLKKSLDHLVLNGSPIDKFRVQAHRRSLVIPPNKKMASFWPAIRKTISISKPKNQSEMAFFAQKLFHEYNQRLSQELSNTPSEEDAK